MTELLQTPLFGITLTFMVFVGAQKIYQRFRSVFLNPVMLAIASIILILTLGKIPYSNYAKGGDMILFLLGPSVVALAVPLYKRRQEVAQRKTLILTAIFIGSFSSVVSACGLAWVLGGSREVIFSLSAKSVTTPIAIGIVENLGGIPSLTAALVVLTGCLGAICGQEFCNRIGIRSPVAIGLAMGIAAHGIGTARMLEIDRMGGAVAGLAIGLNGLLTTFMVPLLMEIVHF